MQDSQDKIQPRRSFIFTPGLKPEMVKKAINCGTDIVCVELEDGIAAKDKVEARKLALQIFEGGNFPSGIELILRVNSFTEKFGIDDIKAILETNHPPPAIMLPKVTSPEEVLIVDKLLSEAGHMTRLHVIIETNKGLKLVEKIATCSERINALFFGGVDMAADLKCENTWEALLYARSKIVHAAAEAELDVIDVPFLDLNDQESLRQESIKAKELGFTGKGSIHPKQIMIINEVFTPSIDSINKAKKIVTEFEKANTGLVVIDGKLIEKPVLRKMYRLLRIGQKLKII